MATTYHADIQKLYVAYFNRPADVDGLNYWSNIVEAANGNTSAVSAAFAASPEYKAAFAGMGASATVDKIYQNLFGHSADVPGLNFWSTLLAKGTLSIDTIVKNIADGALGSDKVAFGNKVAAAGKFTEALDTTDEIVAYNGVNVNNAAKAFISSITTDASFTAAMVPATLNATVASVLQQTNIGSSFSMASTADNIVGSAANDVISARIFDNQNTFQSGDKINGGAGTGDRLEADIGNSQRFAIRGETTGVEVAAFTAQAISTDTTDNNMQTREVQIDAQRMVGVNQWENNNSRADLLIEDVRILDSQITKDITIAMVETDPGHVDFGVYFDQYSLRSATNSSNLLRLQLIDTRSAVANEAPLKESPYNGFAFFFRGVLTTIKSDEIDAAQNYDQLLAAIQKAVAATPGMGGVVVAKGAQFTVTDTTTALPVTGTEIVLTSTVNGDTINANGAGAGWVAAGAVPPNSGLHTNMSSAASTSVELVTSKIILDDVGRGSTGGDLVVGGLSVGDTSTSKGVERFEIEVRDNSKLQTINSTNNTLREVTIKNGVTTSNSFAYVSTTKDKGDLTVNGSLTGFTGTGEINQALPGTAIPGQPAQHNAWGFSDVRMIDASAMTGKLAFSAEITRASITKYINPVDFQAAPGSDNIAFVYTGGANNDTMNVAIDGEVAGSNSLLLTGREDFTFTANGGAGNDSITVAMVNGSQPGANQNWYFNQSVNANVNIIAGEGDDVVRTPGAGNVAIDLGVGNDTAYTDNTGSSGHVATAPGGVNGLSIASPKAVWVFNTGNQANVGAGYVLAGNEERNLADLRGDIQESYNLYNARLTVTYKGLTSTVTIPSFGYKTTDGNVNQAMKDAINNNAVLNKLIVAADGPENTLIVTSLIDGAQLVGDLGISVAVPAASTLSAGDVAAAAAAYGLVAPSSEAAVLAAMTTASVLFNTTGDYVSQFAETGVAGTPADTELVGANSFTTSDNLVTGGLGNDVIVFGTTVGVDALTSSNEIAIYNAGAFGNDTIVHFNATGFGADQLSFFALNGSGAAFSGAAVSNTNRSIAVVVESTANDTAAEIAAFYADDATASNHVYVAYDANNIGKVYTVADAAGTGTGNVVVTLVGTIDLADTGWGTLTAGNFTAS